MQPFNGITFPNAFKAALAGHKADKNLAAPFDSFSLKASTVKHLCLFRRDFHVPLQLEGSLNNVSLLDTNHE